MGRARELTMGTRRRTPKPGSTPEFAALKRLTAATEPDPELLRELIDRVGTRPERLRAAEGYIYAAACARYSAITGHSYGPAVTDKPLTTS